MYSINLIVHFIFILILFCSISIFTSSLFLSCFIFCPFNFQFFSSCYQSNGSGALIASLLIAPQHSDLLHTLGYWWYLVCPNWDPELTIVNIINSTQLHHFCSTIYIMDTMSETHDQCTYTSVLAMYVLLFSRLCDI